MKTSISLLGFGKQKLLSATKAVQYDFSLVDGLEMCPLKVVNSSSKENTVEYGYKDQTK